MRSGKLAKSTWINQEKHKLPLSGMRKKQSLLSVYNPLKSTIYQTNEGNNFKSELQYIYFKTEFGIKSFSTKKNSGAD